MPRWTVAYGELDRGWSVVGRSSSAPQRQFGDAHQNDRVFEPSIALDDINNLLVVWHLQSKMSEQKKDTGRNTDEKPKTKKFVRRSSFQVASKSKKTMQGVSLTLSGSQLSTPRLDTAQAQPKTATRSGRPAEEQRNTKLIKAKSSGAKAGTVSNASKQSTDDVKQLRSQYNVMIRGCMDDLPALPKSIVRIFLSSTFTDTRNERNSLAREAYPILRDYCAGLGLDFQVVDMRWGVTEDSQNDHSVEALCLQEIKHCQEQSLGPNFVCIVGDKYGFQLIPPNITCAEFEMIQQETQLSGIVNAELLEKWYKKDDNAVPPVYLLQPIRTHLPHFGDHRHGNETLHLRDTAAWKVAVVQLTSVLRAAVTSVFQKGLIKKKELQKYFWSVTECEIVAGILEAANSRDSTLCFFRQFTDLSQAIQDPVIHRFTEVINTDNKQVTLNEDAYAQLQTLACEKIKAVLPKANCSEFQIPWQTGSGIDPTSCPQHSQYMFQFCKAFVENVIRLVDEAYERRRAMIKRREYYTEPEELIHHLRFCANKCQTFCGQKEVLKTVKKYIINGNLRKPLIIHAESGGGKTSIMAMIMKNVKKWITGEHIRLIQFLGTSPATIDIYDVLFSVCGQLADACEIIMEPVGYSCMNSLVQYFPRFLRRVANGCKIPIVILLDSIDQLSSVDSPFNMKWLPLILPVNVRIIISTLPKEHNILESLKLLLPDPTCYIQVPILPDSTIREITSHYLDQKGRRINEDQLRSVIDKFQHDPSPLFLKLLLDKSLTWQSYTKPDDLALSNTAREAISQLFLNLEKKFGDILVKATLGYITVSLNGITEIELEDVLSCDDDVLNSVYLFHDPPVDGIIRIPPLLWSRIYNDLKEYLVERLSHGKTTLYWYHRQFIEVAQLRYTQGANGEKLNCNLLEIYVSENGVKRDITLTKRNLTIPNADRQIVPQPMIIKNRRKLECITHHLCKCTCVMDHNDITNKTYCNFSFLSTKIAAFSVQHVISNMSDFLQVKYDAEVDIVKNILSNATHADLRVPAQLALQLLAGINNGDKQMDLENLSSSALLFLLKQESPCLIPTGPCFAVHDNISDALRSSLTGVKRIMSVAGDSVCIAEERVEDGIHCFGVYNLSSEQHNSMDECLVSHAALNPKFTMNGDRLCIVAADSFTFHSTGIVDKQKDAVKYNFSDIEGIPVCDKPTAFDIANDDTVIGICFLSGCVCICDIAKKALKLKKTFCDGVLINNIVLINHPIRAAVISVSMGSDLSGKLLLLAMDNDDEESQPQELQLRSAISDNDLEIYPSFSEGALVTGVCASTFYAFTMSPLSILHEVAVDGLILSAVAGVRGSALYIALLLDNQQVDMYNVQTGQKLVTYKSDMLQPCVLQFTSSADDSILLIGNTSGYVSVYDFEQKCALGSFEITQFSNIKQCFTTDKFMITLTGSGSELKIWDMNALQQSSVFGGHGIRSDANIFSERQTSAIEVSHDSKLLYSASNGQVATWSLPSGLFVKRFDCRMNVDELCVAKGSSEILLIFNKSEEIFRIFDADLGMDVSSDLVPQAVMAYTLSKDKQTLYLISHVDVRLHVHQIEIPRLKLMRTFPVQKGMNFGQIACLLSCTERFLVLRVECTEEDHKVINAALKKGGHLTQPHDYRFSAIDLSHNTGTLLHCCRQMTKIPLLGIVMMPYKGNTMALSVRRSIIFWDIPTGKCDQHMSKTTRLVMMYRPEWTGGDKCVGANTFVVPSANQKFVAVGSEDGYVFVYDYENGLPYQRRAPETKHSAKIRAMDVSQNSAWIASACSANVLKLWSSNTGEECFSLKLRSTVKQLKFTPDSQFLTLLTVNEISRVLVFQVYDGAKI